jgi:ATP-dependent Clp protease ATP-binding subunit ClpA
MAHPVLRPELEISLQLAVLEATRRRHELTGVEHLLYALLHDDSTAQAIAWSGADVDQLKARLDLFLGAEMETLPEGRDAEPSPTLGFRRVVQQAVLQVMRAGREEVTGAHVVIAMWEEADSFAVHFLEEEGVTRVAMMQYVAHGGGTAVTRIEPLRRAREDRPPADPDGADIPQPGEALRQFTRSLTESAAEGRLDPLVGREPEIARTIQILARRRKNNPIFVGDSGVGKTALAEGLAWKIERGEVPAALADAEIYALDLGSLLAGTRYRGDFEERLKAVLRELAERPHAILFVDEIHTLVGAGSTQGGSMDASNLLKPALATGELRCIGSTTWEEYRSHFEKDRALARRFQKVEVEEPSVAETVEILQGLRSRYEDFHGVRFTDGAVHAAAELAHRHLHDRRLPDKAVDLLDEAGAATRLAHLGLGIPEVEVAAVEAVLASLARVPEATVRSSERERLRSLEAELKSRVFGQDAAIERLGAAIKLSRAGLREPEKPIGSFLFTGPTGVGKTEVARSLAEVMGIAIIRFDMSEYMERHAVSRLIGAPPGYVGFEQSGLLTEAVTRTPHAVLLLDEIEKAHPDVFNILLQIMDYGKLTDNNGRHADFRNVVLIMTSNVGAAELARKPAGFGERSSEGEDERSFRDAFPPEFRNRLDGRISFAPLTLPVMERIVDRMIGLLEAQLAERSVTLAIGAGARRWLAERGLDPTFGARPLARLIEEEIKRPLGEEILFGALAEGGHVDVELRDAHLRLEARPRG